MPDANPPSDPTPKPKKPDRRQWLEALSIGYMFPLAIGIGFLWGRWMDRVFGTHPWLVIVFTACGVIAAFRNLFIIGMKDGS
jgi:F0F1-type ATP synthase assembly protein I